MGRYINQHLDWQSRAFSKWGRRAQIVIFPVIFILFFVLAVGWLGYRHVSLPMGLSLGVRVGLGLLSFALGFGLYLWTIVLFAKARGTQVPMAPTQALVTTGPYAVSRNPMVSSAIIMVFGLGVVLNSWSFILASLLLPAHYLVYIKLVEERELEARFGHQYVNYKKSTPFILPRLPKRRPR